MPETLRPYQVIASLVDERRSRSDREILAELQGLPALRDETDPAWDDRAYWNDVGYRFVALADTVALRHLRAAIPLLLDRACFGDPGEMMRGIRHSLEAAVQGDWALLADFCLAAAQSPRLGTRLWAIDQLIVLEDQRARETLEKAIEDGPHEIRSVAQIALSRLNDGAA